MGELEIMSLEFSDAPMTPKPICFVFGDTRRLQIIQENSKLLFEIIIRESSKVSETDEFVKVGKHVCR